MHMLTIKLHFDEELVERHTADLAKIRCIAGAPAEEIIFKNDVCQWNSAFYS